MGVGMGMRVYPLGVGVYPLGVVEGYHHGMTNEGMLLRVTTMQVVYPGSWIFMPTHPW